MKCHDCGREIKTKTCEVHNPEGAKICKGCCIEKFKGHDCKWWALCWA